MAPRRSIARSVLMGVVGVTNCVIYEGGGGTGTSMTDPYGDGWISLGNSSAGPPMTGPYGDGWSSMGNTSAAAAAPNNAGDTMLLQLANWSAGKEDTGEGSTDGGPFNVKAMVKRFFKAGNHLLVPMEVQTNRRVQRILQHLMAEVREGMDVQTRTTGCCLIDYASDPPYFKECTVSGPNVWKVCEDSIQESRKEVKEFQQEYETLRNQWKKAQKVANDQYNEDYLSGKWRVKDSPQYEKMLTEVRELRDQITGIVRTRGTPESLEKLAEKKETELNSLKEKAKKEKEREAQAKCDDALEALKKKLQSGKQGSPQSDEDIIKATKQNGCLEVGIDIYRNEVSKLLGELQTEAVNAADFATVEPKYDAYRQIFQVYHKLVPQSQLTKKIESIETNLEKILTEINENRKKLSYNKAKEDKAALIAKETLEEHSKWHGPKMPEVEMPKLDMPKFNYADRFKNAKNNEDQPKKDQPKKDEKKGGGFFSNLFGGKKA